MTSVKISAVEMVKAIKKGEISSEDIVKSYIEQIKKKEKDVEAFQFFDEELALNQAKKMDAFVPGKPIKMKGGGIAIKGLGKAFTGKR